MICHEFKGGIGTASRVVGATDGGWTVGALVQANYGNRDLLRIDGVPIGREIPVTAVPSPWDQLEALGRASRAAAGSGSIIVVLATDAPLLPHQCARLAQRAGLGVARMGGVAPTTSGDMFLAFATGNRGLPEASLEPGPTVTLDIRMLDDARITPLFIAAVEATEEAIVNALLTAPTMVGANGITAHGLDGARVVEIMARYGRPPAR